MTKISVIIPSIGRESLKSAIDSVLLQSMEIYEVIVVLSLPRLFVTHADKKVKFIQANTFRSISNARNTGLAHISSVTDFVAFCDDDDLWLKDKIAIQLDAIQSNGWDVCLTSATLVNQRGDSIVRPSNVYTGVTSPLRFIYSFFGPRVRYFPFPSLLINVKSLQGLKFDENLNEREDLMFLQDLFESNAKIGQLQQPLIQIDSSPSRSIRRVSIAEDIKWFRRLSTISIISALNFLLYVSLRNHVYRIYLGLRAACPLQKFRRNLHNSIHN